MKKRIPTFEIIAQEIKEHELAVSLLSDMDEKIKSISEKILFAFDRNKKLLICGNGGSAADAQHFSSELIGKYEIDRKPLSAISLSTDPSAVTAISNDYGFLDVFSRQVEGLGTKGDLLLVISSSGNSINLCNAVKTAKSMQIECIGLLGRDGGILQELLDFEITIKSYSTARIQEVHGLIIHIISKIIDCHYNSHIK